MQMNLVNCDCKIHLDKETFPFTEDLLSHISHHLRGTAKDRKPRFYVMETFPFKGGTVLLSFIFFKKTAPF